jgi:hypothetical protein
MEKARVIKCRKGREGGKRELEGTIGTRKER